MRILLANYRYFVSGGSERYMFGVTSLLERAGHEVVPFSVRYARNRETPWAPYFADPIGSDTAVFFQEHARDARTVWRGLQRTFYAPDVYRATERIVRAARPDVALVQQYLRKLSPSLLVALRDAGLPVVVRLSDFGMVCPETHMLRHGQVCRECQTRGLAACVRHKCLGGSLGVSAIGAAGLWFARARRYFDAVDCFVCPSEIMRREMIAGGCDPARLAVIPTFVQASEFDAGRPRERTVVFVGRLSFEKGVHVLLEACARLHERGELDGVRVLILGTGLPDYQAVLQSLAAEVRDHVTFLGEQDAAAVRRILEGAAVSVVPSLWYENLPNSALESLAAGTPVLASDLGSMADILRQTGAGLLFEPGSAEDLARKLHAALADDDARREMSRAARRLAETRYAPEAHLTRLLEVLEAARAGHRRPPRPD